jgi:hypothetical protein
MSLTNSSTLKIAIAQYNDNLLWEGDTAKARNCLEAIRFILVNRPSRMASDAESMDYESLKDQASNIERYLSTATSTVERTSFVQGRMLT